MRHSLAKIPSAFRDIVRGGLGFKTACRRIRLYRIVNRRYNQMLEQTARNLTHVERSITRLNALRDLRDHFLEHVYWFARLVIILCVAGLWIWFMQRAPSTAVTGTVHTTSLSFMNVGEELLKSDGSENTGISWRGAAIFENVRPEERKRNGNFLLTSEKDSMLKVESMYLPQSSLIDVFQQRTNNIGLEIRQSRPDLTSGIKISSTGNGVLREFSAVDSMVLNLREEALTFLNQANTVPIKIDLHKVDKFRIRNLKVTRLAFEQKSPINREAHTAVTGGLVRLVEVKEDSVPVRAGDVVSVGPTDTLRIDIESDPEGFEVKFHGKVSALNIGIEESGEAINKMPSCFRVLFDTNSWILTILWGALTFVIPYLIRSKRQL